MVNGSSALRFEYVADVPWQKSPAFNLLPDTRAYLESFGKAFDKIPTKDLKISFADDVWDFNPYFSDSYNADRKIIFSGLPCELADYCKFFILHKISGKTKIVTARSLYVRFWGVIKNIFDLTSHKSIYMVTTEDILQEIRRRNVAPSTASHLYQAVYQFYYFLTVHYQIKLPVDISVLGDEKDKATSHERQQDTKLPNIPEDYFNIILSKSLSVMRDQKAEHNMRMTAAGLVFLSQTGLRLGELLSLTTDRLREKKLPKSGYIAHYVHYTAFKPSKAHQPLQEFDIFCNPLAAEAFNTMATLRKHSPLSGSNKTLFVLQPIERKRSANYIPHEKRIFRDSYKKFMLHYLWDEATAQWEGIAPAICKTKRPGETKGSYTKTTTYIPDTRQYRVHLCTSLYEQCVPLAYIQRYMGHLTETMMGYYVRPKDTYQENIQYSEKVIREIAGNNITPLGGNMLGQELKETIQKFISDNGFNVYPDIDAVVKALGDKIIIRGKTGGVCIKTSLMPCSKDARTNEMMCAYNLCPNLFHFFYMVDISYLNFKTLQSTYRVMRDGGKTKAAQKELAKIRDLINRRIIPELKELDKEIAQNGVNVILDRYPSLLEIIENREEIGKEIEEWKVKQLHA